MATLDYNAVNNAFKTVFARSATTAEANTYSTFASSDAVASVLYADPLYQALTLPIARLYTAILGRDPEPGGLSYYINQVRDGHLTVDNAATGFLHSPEAQAKFGYVAASDVDFIKMLYQTALGREGEPAGIAYYLNELSGGVRDRASIAVSFSYSPENIARVGEKHYAAFDAVAATKTGTALDGYLKGATVFADANGDGIWNEGEAKAETDDKGGFSLTGGQGTIILTGGIDISTNLKHTGVMKAAAGSTVVNPLTSLQEALVAQGQTVDQAQQAVTKAFGLSASIDLRTYDPLAVAFSATASAAEKAAAVQVQAAAAKLQNLMVAAGGALVGAAGAGQLSAEAASDAVLKSIATAVSGDSDGLVSMGDSAFLQAVLTGSVAISGNAALQAAGASVNAMAGSFATIMADSAGKVDSILSAGAGNTLSALALITQVQSAVQGNVTDQIAAAAGGGTLSSIVAGVTGEGLAGIVSNSKVGDLDPGSTDDNTAILNVNSGGGGGDTTSPPALFTQTSPRARLDASAVDPAGGDMYSGDGNLVTGFQVARADSVGLELALKAKIRGGADGTGSDHVYYVPSGTSAPHRAAWNVDFSIAADTDHNGDVLGRYTYRLLIDVDKGPGTDFKTVDVLGYATDHNFHGGVLNTAAAGKGVVQNSFNFGFDSFQALFGSTPYDFGAGQFDVKLQALDGGTVVLESSIQVVAALPQQVASSASLNASAIDSNGTMYVGNGNPVTGFHTVQAADVGLELAIKAKDRVTGASNATDNVYTVATGTTGSSATWNIDFSIAGDTDHNGSVLNAYAFRILVDVDPTAATRYVTLDALHYAPDNNFHNVGGVQVLNTAATANAVEQNSFNLGFNTFRQAFDDPATAGLTETYGFGNGRFDVKLQALDLVTGNVMLENAIVVLVGTGVA
ncbi:MAG: DUF4214 domain-containing protein [Ramlibacter sp.]